MLKCSKERPLTLICKYQSQKIWIQIQTRNIRLLKRITIYHYNRGDHLPIVSICQSIDQELKRVNKKSCIDRIHKGRILKGKTHKGRTHKEVQIEEASKVKLLLAVAGIGWTSTSINYVSIKPIRPKLSHHTLRTYNQGKEVKLLEIDKWPLLELKPNHNRTLTIKTTSFISKIQYQDMVLKL